MKNLNWKKIRKIFFVGIKGVGMTPLALIAKETGFEVKGSDVAEEFITDEVLKENEIKVYESFDKKIVKDFFEGEEKDSCLVITTGAHSGYKNPQVLVVQDMGIAYLNQGQALGIFMKGDPFGRRLAGFTVTGSHGKTTISAMLASCLVNLGLDPAYSVGTSRIFPIGKSGNLGKGNLFVAEGDEYVGEPVFDKTPKILYQNPKFAIINNIDFDHPDIYKDIAEVKKVMASFVNGMEQGGVLFINSADKNLKDLLGKIREDIKVITYGELSSDYSIVNISSGLGAVSFDVKKRNKNFYKFSLSVPGEHNARNALAVVAFLDSFGVEKEKIAKTIYMYKGCKRRMEVVGKTKNDSLIIDDYAHHPIEIKSTLRALKEFYGKKIICVFQSHTYSRTRKLLNDFTCSFDDVDKLILIPIFKSQRDTESDIMSDEEFLEAFKNRVGSVVMENGINSAFEYINKQNFGDDVIVVTMGAGDVYKVGYKLKS